MYFFFIFLSIFHGFLRCPFSVFDLFGWFLGFVWIWRDLFFKKLYLLPCCWNSFCLVCWLVIEKCKLSILLVEKIWKSCKKRCQFGFFSLLYFFLRVEVFFFFFIKIYGCWKWSIMCKSWIRVIWAEIWHCCLPNSSWLFYWKFWKPNFVSPSMTCMHYFHQLLHLISFSELLLTSL